MGVPRGLRRLADRLRARRAAAIAGAAAIGVACAGVLAVAHPESPRATAHALVDAPKSLLATGAPRDAATAPDRAAALAALIARPRGRLIVAAAAGVAPGELDVVVADLATPAAPTPVARTAAAARAARPVALTVGLGDREVPVVTLVGEAADPAVAERVAEGGIAALEELAAQEPGTPPSVVIRPLGGVELEPGRAAPGRAAVGALGLVAAGVWLAALALAGARGGRRRAGGARGERRVAAAGRAA